jgi:hypothetical protein
MGAQVSEVADKFFFEKVEVGMFRLPGLRFEKGQIPTELYEEMAAWAKENHCGTPMNEWLWSFKSEEKRSWFILRWADVIPAAKEDED